VSARWHAMRHLLGSGLRATGDLLLPPACTACGAVLSPRSRQPLFCDACREVLGASPGPLCPRCASPLGPTERGDDCFRCRDRRYHFAAATALGVYRGPLRDAVIRMKQLCHEPLTLAMGHLLAERQREWVSQHRPDLLLPMPTHWFKRLVRGVNGPDLLAESLGERLEIPAFMDLLLCRRRTRKQGTLLPSERLVNVRDAFRVSADYDVTGATVLLVDDIMTTGASASEAARTLRRAGAGCVLVVLVARGVGADQRGSHSGTCSRGGESEQ
jgi:predicted amidophosphoribosyltransferase